MGRHPIYLWTLPMFHCNGWCFPWTLSVVAGTHVCLRWVRAKSDLRRAGRPRRHAPVRRADRDVDAAQRRDADEAPLPRKVEFMTAAAPPPAAVLAALEDEGFHVTHVYGLTEVYGPAIVCDWHEDWDALPRAERRAQEGAPGRALRAARRRSR